MDEGADRIRRGAACSGDLVGDPPAGGGRAVGADLVGDPLAEGGRALVGDPPAEVGRAVVVRLTRKLAWFGHGHIPIGLNMHRPTLWGSRAAGGLPFSGGGSSPCR